MYLSIGNYSALDSKLISSLSNSNVSEECLTVTVGGKKELKLIGVPSNQPGTP